MRVKYIHGSGRQDRQGCRCGYVDADGQTSVEMCKRTRAPLSVPFIQSRVYYTTNLNAQIRLGTRSIAIRSSYQLLVGLLADRAFPVGATREVELANAMKTSGRMMIGGLPAVVPDCGLWSPRRFWSSLASAVPFSTLILCLPRNGDYEAVRGSAVVETSRQAGGRAEPSFSPIPTSATRST